MPYVAIGMAVASIASAYMKKRSAGEGGGDFIPPSDSSLHYFGGDKTINFSGSGFDSMRNMLIGAGVVVAIAWLKRAKGKK